VARTLGEGGKKEEKYGYAVSSSVQKEGSAALSYLGGKKKGKGGTRRPCFNGRRKRRKREREQALLADKGRPDTNLIPANEERAVSISRRKRMRLYNGRGSRISYYLPKRGTKQKERTLKFWQSENNGEPPKKRGEASLRVKAQREGLRNVSIGQKGKGGGNVGRRPALRQEGEENCLSVAERTAAVIFVR